MARTVGRRVRALRQARDPPGNTLAWLARRTGMSISFLSMVENGRRLPSLTALASLSDALEVRTGDLLGADSTPQALRPIATLFREHKLGQREARRLLEVARRMFP